MLVTLENAGTVKTSRHQNCGFCLGRIVLALASALWLGSCVMGQKDRSKNRSGVPLESCRRQLPSSSVRSAMGMCINGKSLLGFAFAVSLARLAAFAGLATFAQGETGTGMSKDHWL